MRLIWTKTGVRGRIDVGQPERQLQRISLRGYQRGFEMEVETADEVIRIIRRRGEERREVRPRARQD